MSTVTCSATSKAWKSSGEPATSSGTTTSRPPPSSAAQISHTEKSKRIGVALRPHLLGGQVRSGVDSARCVRLWWVIATPLGTPVVPEV